MCSDVLFSLHLSAHADHRHGAPACVGRQRPSSLSASTGTRPPSFRLDCTYVLTLTMAMAWDRFPPYEDA